MTPRVSVIVPAHQAAATLGECLAALRLQDWPAERIEVLCVDDASTDATAQIAARVADRVVRLDAGPHGPAAARNAGAAAASGDVLVFLDADVLAAPDTVRRLVAGLTEDPAVQAVFGSYDAAPRHAGLVSEYRNLLHHYVHQTSRAEAETFWAGCGAVRREAFLRAGGFDAARYPKPSIEDIELGRRMRAAGMRIRLLPEVQVQHLKRWTLKGMLRTDVGARGVPWARLLLERGGAAAAGASAARSRREVGDLNLKVAAVASVPLAWASATALAGSLRKPALGWVAVGCAAGVVALNAPLTAFFWRARGPRFAVATLPLQFLYHLANGVSMVYALSAPERRRPAPGGDGPAPAADGPAAADASRAPCSPSSEGPGPVV